MHINAQTPWRCDIFIHVIRQINISLFKRTKPWKFDDPLNYSNLTENAWDSSSKDLILWEINGLLCSLVLESGMKTTAWRIWTTVNKRFIDAKHRRKNLPQNLNKFRVRLDHQQWQRIKRHADTRKGVSCFYAYALMALGTCWPAISAFYSERQFGDFYFILRLLIWQSVSSVS